MNSLTELNARSVNDFEAATTGGRGLVARASVWRDASFRAARVALFRQLPIVVVAVPYIVFGAVAWIRLVPAYVARSLVPYSAAVGLFALFSFILGASAGTWIFRRSGYRGTLFALHPWWALARERISPTQLFEIGILVAVIPAFMNAFTAFKVILPLLHPFAFDVQLHGLDRALHFGFIPSDLTHRLLPAAKGLHVISFLYHNVWHLLLFLAITACLWTRSPQLRQRFFLSIVLTWSLLGTVLATLLSSVGPCYYAEVTGDVRTYGTLMSTLQAAHRHSPIGAVDGQRTIWNAYASGDYSLQVGISAMPSLHVAMAVLIALLAWRVHRALGVLAFGYAAFVLFGSVHLGWHYAVDGYVSIGATVVIWWGVGRFVRWYNDSFSGASSYFV
jgi:hypothetical protein